MANIPSKVLMVRPAAFAFNPQTAVNNAFQHELEGFSAAQIQDIALLEFDHMVDLLQAHGIEVIIAQDSPEAGTPDSIFPNNWFSTFGGQFLIYSMYSENRRKERKQEIIDQIQRINNMPPNDELLSLEAEGAILEGTGSLVCDHKNKVAYAAISQRTDHKALDLFESISGYETVRFRALGPDGTAIYHTNVMMCIADKFAVIGLDSIVEEDRQRVRTSLENAGLALIPLNNTQVFEHFAGNMLQLQNEVGQKFLLMSKEAFGALDATQVEQIHNFDNQIIAPAIHLIEKIGGGSVRCMMAEIF